MLPKVNQSQELADLFVNDKQLVDNGVARGIEHYQGSSICRPIRAAHREYRAGCLIHSKLISGDMRDWQLRGAGQGVAARFLLPRTGEGVANLDEPNSIDLGASCRCSQGSPLSSSRYWAGCRVRRRLMLGASGIGAIPATPIRLIMRPPGDLLPMLPPTTGQHRAVVDQPAAPGDAVQEDVVRAVAARVAARCPTSLLVVAATRVAVPRVAATPVESLVPEARAAVGTAV